MFTSSESTRGNGKNRRLSITTFIQYKGSDKERNEKFCKRQMKGCPYDMGKIVVLNINNCETIRFKMVTQGELLMAFVGYHWFRY
jgi:hypothetical protein